MNLHCNFSFYAKIFHKTKSVILRDTSILSLKLDFLSKQQNCVQESVLRTIDKLENLTLNIHVYNLFKTSFIKNMNYVFV